MILLAIIGFIGLYFLLGIRDQAHDVARMTREVAVQLERMNDASAKEGERARHERAHGKGRA